MNISIFYNYFFILLYLLLNDIHSQTNYNILSKEEKKIIIHKGTERPFTGKYNNHFVKGTYVCKQCNQNLYNSKHKFISNCGWPSFDDAIKGSTMYKLNTDGKKNEILCSNCNGHLGHYFIGENYTDKNVRHCVNSLSLDFDKE